jgi:hypothetical protein
MAYKKYELKFVFVIDDSIKSASDDVKNMQKQILSGESQKELLEQPGFLNMKATLKEIK